MSGCGFRASAWRGAHRQQLATAEDGADGDGIHRGRSPAQLRTSFRRAPRPPSDAAPGLQRSVEIDPGAWERLGFHGRVHIEATPWPSGRVQALRRHPRRLRRFARLDAMSISYGSPVPVRPRGVAPWAATTLPRRVVTRSRRTPARVVGRTPTGGLVCDRASRAKQMVPCFRAVRV